MPRAVSQPGRLCARLLPALHAGLIGVTVLAGSARAQNTDPPGTLLEMPLPGGLRAALVAIGDRSAADRSQFLLEFIRRTHHAPVSMKNDGPDMVVLRSLLAHLDVSSRTSGAPAASAETLPLPLPAAIWIDVVFGGRATPQNLVSAILSSRNAALLYSGLLSLDDATRAWLATRPDLVGDLAARHAAALLVAAPGLRVMGAAMRVPGGAAAEPAWEALVGRRANEPADFVRALLGHGEGRLACFFGAMAQLTNAQIRRALDLESPDAADRIAAARRLYAIFERIGVGWRIEERAFWRPTLDPALLIADLRVDENGRPMAPGTRRFWSTVFADADPGRTTAARDDDARALAAGEPVDLAWLCEQIFKGDQTEQRRRYQLVMFASRIVRQVTPETAHDTIDAIRAAASYPALVAVLERARLVDIASFASAARRATRLSAIQDDDRAVRALAQFQGTLALVTRAALRGSLTTAALSRLVSSLSGVDFNERGDYEGRLVAWLDANLREPSRPASSAAAMSAESSSEVYDNAAGPVERDLLRMMAGPQASEPRVVDWEGTRYRLDLAGAEATRLARLLGEQPRPFLSSAQALVVMADALGEAGLTRERLRQEAGVLERLAKAVVWERSDSEDAGPPRDWSRGDPLDRYRTIAAALQRTAREGDVRAAPRLAPALRVLADDLLARGLTELAYAAALGQPDRALVSAWDAASRHDFGPQSSGERRSVSWQLPAAGVNGVRGWHVIGSLLGLDVKLSEFSLMRLSLRLPPKKPMVNDAVRRVFVEAVALVEPASLTETDGDTIVTAIRKGRARLAAVRTPIEAVALADEIRLSPARRSLLSWVVAHEPERVPAFLSPSELLWLGLERMPISTTLHGWGAPSEPRLGCLCLELIDRRPLETLAGRWHSGILASGFPDLNLRLAELLAELRMPAALLGPVLAAATLDLINSATSRDQDDRRGLVEFVQALRRERVEQYLALLTTDGPLVPIDGGARNRGSAGGPSFRGPLPLSR